MNRRQFLQSATGVALLLPSWAAAQQPERIPPGYETPDERGEVWAPVQWNGHVPYCNIPRALRQRNTDGSAPGGSDGLCVIASQVTDGRYQSLVREVNSLWETAKQRPGGYHPAKMKALAYEIMPHVPFKSYEGRETGWMEAVLKQGIPIGTTMGTGRAYHYARIAHMVSTVHYSASEGIAAIIDNNWPAAVVFLPIQEYARRFTLGLGYGWAFYWDVPTLPSVAASSEIGPALALGLTAGAGFGVAVHHLAVRSRTDASALPDTVSGPFGFG